MSQVKGLIPTISFQELGSRGQRPGKIRAGEIPQWSVRNLTNPQSRVACALGEILFQLPQCGAFRFVWREKQLEISGAD